MTAEAQLCGSCGGSCVRGVEMLRARCHCSICGLWPPPARLVSLWPVPTLCIYFCKCGRAIS